MAKNKGKSKTKSNNQNSQTQKSGQNTKSISSVTQTSKTVIKELTSEQKEKLINEGQEQKEMLIQKGLTEEKAIIEKANLKALSIIEDAEKRAKSILDTNEKKVEKEQKKFEKEKEILFENMNKEVEVKGSEILLQYQKQGLKIQEDAQNEIDTKSSAIKLAYTELEEKKKLLFSEKIELDNQKNNYRTEVFNEFKSKFESVQAELEKSSTELHESIRTIEKMRKQEVSYLEDIKELETQLETNVTKKSEIMTKNTYIKQLESDKLAINDLYAKVVNELREKEMQILLYGDNPNEVLREKNQLEKEIIQLNDRLADLPKPEELTILREKTKKYEQLLQDYQVILTNNIELTERNNNALLYKDDLDNSKRFIKALELQKYELQRELDHYNDMYNKPSDNIYPSLMKIDERFVIQQAYTDTRKTLKDICSDFKNYLASRDDEHLYYSDRTIRTFIAAFSATRLMILEGLSGTGKSSLPKAFKDYASVVTDVVPVQSSWKDRNDLLGFYNDFKKQYKETDFLKKLYEAALDKDNIHCIVLDEMNLSRIEYYFADLLSILENDEQSWQLELIAESIPNRKEPKQIEDGVLNVYGNTWFIGTANRDDSTQTITDKVYDRSIVIDFQEREKEPKDFKKASKIQLSFSEFKKLIDRASKITPEDEKKLKEIIEKLDKKLKDKFDITFGNRIDKQLRKFIPTFIECGGDFTEGFDIIFSTKVLRKLQGFYDEKTKSSLNEFLDDLNKDYPNGMHLSKNTIIKLIDRIE